ncbi:hypothetical protein SEVIR_3G324045v4 [Setaria viridis]
MLKSGYRACDADEEIVALAADGFHSSYAVYQEELQHLKSWVKEMRLDELEFARVLPMHNLFTSTSTTMFPSELSEARIAWSKNTMLTTAVDDLFDVVGTREELENLITLIDMQCCAHPHLARIIHTCITHVGRARRSRLLLRARGDPLPRRLQHEQRDRSQGGGSAEPQRHQPRRRARESLHQPPFQLQSSAVSPVSGSIDACDVAMQWAEMVRAMMAEAEWRMTGHVPSMEEYMSVGLPSFALGRSSPRRCTLLGRSSWMVFLFIFSFF